MFSSGNSLNKVHTNQYKFIQERITGVEKHFGQICNAFGAYTRKTARLRDTGDDLAAALVQYGEHESLNKSLRAALCEAADTLAAVQDHRNIEVERLEGRVTGEVAVYGGLCRAARDDLKRSFHTRRHELDHRRSLERTKTRTPQNRQQIAIAETKLQKSTAEARRACRGLEEQMDQFEQRKVADMKRILQEFMQTELAFHAKALELYTKAYNQISSIDEEEDLEEFRNALKGDAGGRGEVVGAGQGATLSPAIVPPQHARPKRDIKKSIEKLKVEDYEEINGSTSSDED